MSTFIDTVDLPLSDKELYMRIMSGDLPGFIDLSECPKGGTLSFDGNDIVDTMVLNDVLGSVASMPTELQSRLFAVLEASYGGDLAYVAMAILDVEFESFDFEPLDSADEEDDREGRLEALGYVRTLHGFVRV